MALVDLTDWLNEFSGTDYVWYVKRLSGNDTLANKAHQAGPYIPRDLLFRLFPLLDQPGLSNPDFWFNLYIDSHADHRNVRAVWYNNKLHDNPKSGRNEARITNFGGSASALLDPDSTGALTIFAFALNDQRVATECHVWVCNDQIEEDLVEDRIGPVEPGKGAVWSPEHSVLPSVLAAPPKLNVNCWLDANQIPPDWLFKFPTGAAIIKKAVEMRSDASMNPDKRLMRRRACEFDIFRSVEEAVELPVIKQGFESIDDFVARAQTILQRRKSRSGRSLELHAREIFLEEGLHEGTQFVHQPKTDPGKKTDFLFPSEMAYEDKGHPDARLRMLAVKTTCKDRWRQILPEADRISRKHLLTLQEGVSENQFKEMTDAGVQLVVPALLVSKFPTSVQPHLQTFESFIGDVRLLNL